MPDPRIENLSSTFCLSPPNIKSNLINFQSAVIFLRFFFAKKFEIGLQVVHLVHGVTDI